MASILIYAGVQGYKKYKLKRANSSADQLSKSKRDRKSISSLVIPSITFAHFPIDEKRDDSNLPHYDEDAQEQPPQYTAPYLPEHLGAPLRTAPPPPVMLGLTLCESPSTSKNELHSHSPIHSEYPFPSELPGGDSPIDRLSKAFELYGDEGFSEPLSPAPLRVVKRSSSTLPPELTYSSDESEDEFEEHHYKQELNSLLEVPTSAHELLDFEAPPIPPKSPARKLRVASS